MNQSNHLMNEQMNGQSNYSMNDQMYNQKSHALSGTHNQRINKTTQSDNEVTAAWTGEGCHAPKSNVTIPSSSAVENAKEWVDNGSRL